MQAGRLIGVRTFRNELVAYGELKILRDNRDLGTMPKFDPLTGKLNWMDEISEAILSFALCGFGNIGSVAIFLGATSKLCYTRFQMQNAGSFQRFGAPSYSLIVLFEP